VSSHNNVVVITVGIVAGALVALLLRGLAPELVRYLKIRRM